MLERSITTRFFLTCLWSSPRRGRSPAAHQWSNPGGGRSAAVPAAHSFRPAVSSGPLTRCNPFPCTNPFLFFYWVAGVSIFRSLRCPQFLLRLGVGRTFQNAFSLSSHIAKSRPSKLVNSLGFLVILSMPSSSADIAASWNHGPIYRFCIRSCFAVSFQVSFFWRLL
jgi:hypothetical protein